MKDGEAETVSAKALRTAGRPGAVGSEMRSRCWRQGPKE